MSRKLKWFEKLSDADLWGISCAIQHCLNIAHFEEKDILWAEGMLSKIRAIRDIEVKT